MRDRLTELRHTNRDEYVSKCNTKYEDFFTKYPTLFYKIIDDPISSLVNDNSPNSKE